MPALNSPEFNPLIACWFAEHKNIVSDCFSTSWSPFYFFSTTNGLGTVQEFPKTEKALGLTYCLYSLICIRVQQCFET